MRLKIYLSQRRSLQEAKQVSEDKKKTAEAVSSGESFALGEGKAKSSIVGIEVFYLDYVKACIC